MSVQDSASEPRERDWSELLHIASQQDPITGMRDQLISERVVKSSGVGMGRATQVTKRNSGKLRTFGGARPAVVTHYNDNLSRQRPVSTRVNDGLQDSAAVGCKNSDIHSHTRHIDRRKRIICLSSSATGDRTTVAQSTAGRVLINPASSAGTSSLGRIEPEHQRRKCPPESRLTCYSSRSVS